MVMRRSVLPALSLALALTACGFSDASDGDAGESSSSAPSTSSAAASGTGGPEVARNERGNIPVQVGEEAAIRASNEADGAPMLTLEVEEIAIDPVCDDDSEVPPENGHYVALLLRASATPEFDPRVVTSINDFDFHIIGSDGSTYEVATDAGRACFGPPRLLQNMRIGPGADYEGWMVLDAPVDSGALVYAPGGETNGWEWQF
jgi:hypothetical protein